MDARHRMLMELRFNNGQVVERTANGTSVGFTEVADADARRAHRVRMIDDGDDGDTVYIRLGSKPLHIVIERRDKDEQTDDEGTPCEHEVDWKSVSRAGRDPFELGASCIKCGENGFAAVPGGLFSWNDEDS